MLTAYKKAGLLHNNLLGGYPGNPADLMRTKVETQRLMGAEGALHGKVGNATEGLSATNDTPKAGKY